MAGLEAVLTLPLVELERDEGIVSLGLAGGSILARGMTS